MASKIKYPQNYFIQKLQSFLLGRKNVKDCLRFKDTISPRSTPEPNLPDGVYHKLYQNSYFKRDARRLVRKPTEINVKNLLEDSLKHEANKNPVPGNVYNP